MSSAVHEAPPDPSASALRRSLLRYRVMAYTTAVLLIVLVFVGVPLQLAANRPEVVNVVGTMHGMLYIVYLFTAFDLTRRLKLRFTRMAMVLLAGTVPFCAIVAERLLTRMIARSSQIGDPLGVSQLGVSQLGVSQLGVQQQTMGNVQRG